MRKVATGRRALTLLFAVMGLLIGSMGAGAAWAPGPDMLEPTDGAAATLLGDGSVLVVGGRGTREEITSNQRFDPTSGRWSFAAAFTVPRGGVSLVTLDDGSGFAVGGAENANFAAAERYDPVTGTWTVPDAADSHGGVWPAVAVLQDGRVLAIGGNYYDTSSNSVDVFDPATSLWTRTTSYPFFIQFNTATLLNDGRVLSAGGLVGLGDFGSPPTDAVEIYDPAARTWTAAARLPTARTWPASVTLDDGRVLLVGGLPAGSPALLYDVRSDRWTATRALPAGADPRRLVLLPDGRVLGIGGTDGGTGTTTAALFDPATNGWTNAGPLLAKRGAWFTATLLDDGTVLVAGGSDAPGTSLSSTEIWTPDSTPPPPDCTPHPGRGHGKAKGRHKHGHECKGGPKAARTR